MLVLCGWRQRGVAGRVTLEMEQPRLWRGKWRPRAAQPPWKPVAPEDRTKWLWTTSVYSASPFAGTIGSVFYPSEDSGRSYQALCSTKHGGPMQWAWQAQETSCRFTYVIGNRNRSPRCFVVEISAKLLATLLSPSRCVTIRKKERMWTFN